MTLFIISQADDVTSFFCRPIERNEFDGWLQKRIDGVNPEEHPKFVKTIGELRNYGTYLVVEGRVIVPKPVTVTTAYTLDGA